MRTQKLEEVQDRAYESLEEARGRMGTFLEAAHNKQVGG